MNFGIFTISLDFELHWGGFEKWDIARKRQDFLNTRKMIPVLLQAFEATDVHVSWATVGLLMHKNRQELMRSVPPEKPAYEDGHLSAYRFIEKGFLGENEDDDPCHYADSLVRTILKTRYQELASHSFAHYYCNEPGQTPLQFDADAKAWNKAAQHYGICSTSLVFPRNQFNATYLKKCRENGIRVVRTNPKNWWWRINSTQNESKWKRLNRGLDAYLNTGGKTSYSLQDVEAEQGIWLLPASRLLRPYHPKELFLDDLKVSRIKKEMTVAARRRECYHLWWHPHNFGHHPKQNIDALIELLNHYTLLKKKYDMRSLNMREMADVLDKTRI